MGQYWTRRGEEEFEDEKTINPFEEKQVKSDRNVPKRLNVSKETD